LEHSIKAKTVRGVFWSSIERFSVQGIQFILGVIIARLLDPSDYGVIGMLAIFLAVSQTFIDSGFSNALIRKQDRTETDFSTVFYFNIGVGLFFYLLLFLASPFIARFYNTQILKDITKVIALNLVFNSLAVVQRAKLTILVDFKTQAKISLLATVISGTTGLIMAYKGLRAWALVFQSVLNSGLSMIFFWLFLRWKPLKVFSMQSFRELFFFGSKLLLSELLETIYKNIYTIVIGKKFHTADLGYYTRADQFAQFPSANLTGIFQRVTFSILCGIQDDDEKLKKVYLQYLRIAAFIIFPLMCGLAAVTKPFILSMLTEKWAGIVPILQFLCFSYMLYPVHAINLNLLQVKGRSDLFLRLEVLKKIVGILILCITIPHGLIVMCASTIVSSFICLIINTYYTGKIISVGFFVQMKNLFPIFLTSLTMSVVVYLISNIFANNIIKLLLGIISGIIFYFFVNIIIGSKELKLIFEMIAIKRKGHNTNKH
jgi:O-antigen/teichoic acid export membrane protein